MPSYSAGDWHAVVTADSIALLAPAVPADALESIWAGMTPGAALAAVIDGLVGVYGTSPLSLPPFAVVAFDRSVGHVSVVVRGPVVAAVTDSASGSHQVSGLGVSTWVERVVDDAATVRIAAGADDGPRLPLRDGVAHAGGIVWDLVSAEASRTVLPAADVDVSSPAAASAAPNSVPEPAPVSAPQPEPEPEPEPQLTLTPQPQPQPQPEPEPEPERQPALSPEPETAPVQVQEENPAPAVEETRAPVVEETFATPPHEEAAIEMTTGYDDLLFGETRYSSVEDAAVRTTTDEPPIVVAAPSVAPPVPAPPVAAPPPVVPPTPPAPAGLIVGLPPVPPPPSAVPAPALGDHDGETISAEQFALLQQRLGGAVPSADAPAAAAGQPPTLVVSSGERFVLDRPAVVGRRPRVVRATGALPHLVTVTSPNQDVSRSHVELRVEGLDVLVVDLDTMNGTRLLREGADPVRLQPGEPTLLVGSDRIDLGDGVLLSFEGLR